MKIIAIKLIRNQTAKYAKEKGYDTLQQHYYKSISKHEVIKALGEEN